MNTPADNYGGAVPGDAWVGLLHVAPTDDASGLERGMRAFVWVAVAARDVDQFLEHVRTAANQMSLKIEAAEDVAPALRTLHGRRNREMRQLAVKALTRPTNVAWGTFHAYENDECEGRPS